MGLFNVLSTSHVFGAPKKWSLESFWKMADTTHLEAEYKIDQDLQHLAVASPEELRKIFVQYRFFTIYYITDLALLVSRLPFGSLRSSLGLFLAEELGNGKADHAHPALYDNFLRTMGVPDKLFEKQDSRNQVMLQQIQKDIQTKSIAHAIGVRGMGGECLCQIYLSVMFERFSMNPYFKKHKDSLALRFWEIHTGPEDIEHREQTRRAINQYLQENPKAIQDLAEGYEQSKIAWDVFWKNIFASARQGR